MRNPIVSFCRLPAAERAVVMRACLLFPVTALGIRSVGMRRTQGLLRSLLSRDTGIPAPARVAHLIERTADDVRPHPQCLVRSLVLEAMLQSAGEPAVLRLGVRRTPIFEAHAWVELDGIALNDDASFKPFTRSAAPPSD